jgi:hypothetical protein
MLDNPKISRALDTGVELFGQFADERLREAFAPLNMPAREKRIAHALSLRHEHMLVDCRLSQPTLCPASEAICPVD